VYITPINVPFLCLHIVCKNCSFESILISDLIIDFATGVDVVLNDETPPVVNRLSIGIKFD
jgi:hypothetical protein